MNYFALRFLPQTFYLLLYTKCSSVTRTKYPITMYKISKSDIFGNFGPLIKLGPHWISFIILTFISENNR
jgi:hypothetical protein